jgi:hypothetical protein
MKEKGLKGNEEEGEIYYKVFALESTLNCRSPPWKMLLS